MTQADPGRVLRLAELDIPAVGATLARYGLTLRLVPDDQNIPGSFWGECEAGLVRDEVFVRGDTPLHSLLHESCHYICMTPDRRVGLDTDAGGDHLEECGVCSLQVLLADEVGRGGRERTFRDMDDWGYSFRLGSARDWFEQDAEDARLWLLDQGIIGGDGRPTWALRG
ncbi:MAG: hypothetical protein RLZZ393_973 [Pseudomonadota bacterium]